MVVVVPIMSSFQKGVGAWAGVGGRRRWAGVPYLAPLRLRRGASGHAAFTLHCKCSTRRRRTSKANISGGGRPASPCPRCGSRLPFLVYFRRPCVYHTNIEQPIFPLSYLILSLSLFPSYGSLLYSIHVVIFLLISLCKKIIEYL